MKRLEIFIKSARKCGKRQKIPESVQNFIRSFHFFNRIFKVRFFKETLGQLAEFRATALAEVREAEEQKGQEYRYRMPN